MIKENELRHLTEPVIFARGRELYQNHGVKELKVELDEEGDLQVEARVKGSGRRTYEVSFWHMTDIDELDAFYCDCPAYYNYDGICKHCVAAALAYMNGGMVLNEDDASASKKITKTTPAIRALMNTQEGKKIQRIQNPVQGVISLEPHFALYSEFSLQFKIGKERKYVLKDVFSFCQRVKDESYYSYGQKLAFLHTLDAFDETSRQVVKWLIDWVDHNMSRFYQHSYYSYSYAPSLPALKEMTVRISDLESLLPLFREQRILFQFFNESEKEWLVTEEPLQRKVKITGYEEGIELQVSKYHGYVGEKYYIYFADGKIHLIPAQSLKEIGGFLQCFANIPGDKIQIAKEDMGIFSRELLPVLEQHFECEKVDFCLEKYGVCPPVFQFYIDSPQKNYLTFDVKVSYGERTFPLFDTSGVDKIRDMILEEKVRSSVSGFCNAYDEKRHLMAIGEDEDRIYEFLEYGVSALQEFGDVYVSDAVKRMRILSSPRVEVGLSMEGGLLELTMSTKDMSMDELIEILSRYQRKKKYYRLSNGSFVKMQDSSMSKLIELKSSLHLTESQLKEGRISLPKYRALYLDEELKNQTFIPVSRDKDFRSLIRDMKTIEDNDFEVPKSLEGILRGYQKTGFLWIKTLCHNGFGGILADDMGLGKTLQVIAFLMSEYEERKEDLPLRTLIVCPASLVFNWKMEFERFAPQLSVRMVVGNAQERNQILSEEDNRTIFLTSYDLLKRDVAAYDRLQFTYQVIDEAQYIKNKGAQVTQAVKKVHSVFRLALTGTPIENRLSELWSIFDYLMPGFLYGYQRFHNEIEQQIIRYENADTMERLKKMVRPFLLRRLKADVLTDLPDKLEECVYVQMESEQRKLYDAHVKRLQLLLNNHTDEEFNQSKIQILAELTKLRQICCEPSLVFEDYAQESAKRDACIDLIKNAVNGGHKILLFSQFTSMLGNIVERLEYEKISYYLLTGATTKTKRQQMVESFQMDDTSVFCISLKAGGTGLNLTAADIVIHYDPWWNQAVQNQATDRTHRIGQKNIVNVYKLIAKDSIEENIVRLQEKKSRLADQILSGTGAAGESFSKEELLELLR